MIQVQINGKTQELETACSVQALLDGMGLHPKQVAVEVNRVIVKREAYASTIIQSGDEIEILHFVGGGAE